MELVCIDFLKVDAASNGMRDILVITDHFTRYAKAVPTRNMSARTTAEALLGFCENFGIPKRLHSDQGANFESKVIRELCVLLGVEKSRTTPFHPMGNGACERFNRTLIRMLGTLPSDKKSAWPKHIGMLVLAYNATPHDSTGFSPFYLLFGRQPCLPVDNLFGRDVKSKQMEGVREALQWAWREAASRDAQGKEKNSKYYDRKVRGATLEIGDRVLVKRCAFEGPHKLSDKWSEDLYTVVEKPHSDMPVYRVRPESGGRLRTLHRNLLLPVQTIRETLPTVVAPVPEAESRQPETSADVPELPSEVASKVDEASEDDSEFEELVYLGTEHTPHATHESAPSVHTPAPSLIEPQVQATPVTSPPGLPPIPAPRRSQRERQGPDWMRSGEYETDPRVSMLFMLLDHANSDKGRVTEEILKLIIK